MNDDIAKRLRRLADRFWGFPDVYADIEEAAEEIARLRAENDRLRRAVTLNAASDYRLGGVA